MGVTKHKSRRDRSIRRLEQTEIDVARLNDILDQQRSRLRPLKRQANAAARPGEVRSDIKALPLWIGGGYEGTHFWIDPVNGFVGVVTSQLHHIPAEGWKRDDTIRRAVYEQLGILATEAP